MTDDDLITTLRESVSGVHMNVPERDVIGRGRTIRTRRRIPAVAAAAGIVAAGTVVTTTALTGPAPAPAAVKTEAATYVAAWTAAPRPQMVKITVGELRHPAALQRALRSYGIPASVTGYNGVNQACREDPAGLHDAGDVFPAPWLIPNRWFSFSAVFRQPPPGTLPPGETLPGPLGATMMRVDMTKLPSGDGIQIAATVRNRHIIVRDPHVVRATFGCTGG